jgi:hypothetical protein
LHLVQIGAASTVDFLEFSRVGGMLEEAGVAQDQARFILIQVFRIDEDELAEVRQ